MVELINNTIAIGVADCGNDKVCCKKDKNLKTISTPCGSRNVMGLGQYQTNVEQENDASIAKLAEFPWIVSIELSQKKICTGSLINEKIVMTSANCVIGKKSDSLQVRTGSWKSSSDVGLQTEELRDVSRIIFLDENVNHFSSNIALLILGIPVETNMFVNSVCLSKSIDNLQMNDCLAVGWGRGQHASDNLIYETNIKILDCEDLANTMQIPDKSKCARILGKFEIGSAVMCRINNTESNYQQVGIMSHENSQQSNHAILIDEIEFQRIIDQKFAELEIDDESFTFSHLSSRWFSWNDAKEAWNDIISFFGEQVTYIYNKVRGTKSHKNVNNGARRPATTRKMQYQTPRMTTKTITPIITTTSATDDDEYID